jgi:hypothetical protein
MWTTTSLIILSAAGLTALGVLAAAWAWTFKGWVELKRAEMGGGGTAPVSGRIELADLRERVKKLEAIAAGVDI